MLHEESRHIPDVPKSNAKSISIYSAIAGALTASTAFAVPTPSPTNVPIEVIDTTLDDGGVSTLIDVDGDGVNDFEPSGNLLSCSGYGVTASLGPESGNGVTGEFYAGLVAPGGTISSGSFSESVPYGVISTCYDTRAYNGYVGIRFDSGGNTHYGYMEIESVQDSGSAWGVIVKQICFESSPNTSIEAGEPCTGPLSVPVGGAIPLSIGLLAMGAVALRRRRKAN